MKKFTLQSLMFVACFALATSCAKDVKKPVSTTNASALSKPGTTTNTNTGTTTQSGTTNTNSGGTCSGSHSGSSGNYGFGG